MYNLKYHVSICKLKHLDSSPVFQNMTATLNSSLDELGVLILL